MIITTTGIKASLAFWKTTDNVANGASLSLIAYRVMNWISVGHTAVELQATAEDDTSWVQMQDRVGALQPTAGTIPTVLNGLVTTNSLHIRLYNGSGLAQDVKASGWFVS